MKHITLSCTAKAFRLTVSFFTVPPLIVRLPTCGWDLLFLKFGSGELKGDRENACFVCVTVFGTPTEVLFSPPNLIEWIVEMKFYLLTLGNEFTNKWWGKYLTSLDLPTPAVERPSPEADECSLESKICVWVPVTSLSSPPWTITVPKLPIKHRFHIRRSYNIIQLPPMSI